MWEFSGLSESALLRRIVHRETVRLVVLTAVAAGAFFMTRALAHRAEELAVRDAAEWYERGQAQLAAGRPQDAATAFRRATMKRRGEKRYALALATALARGGNTDAATRALLDLREFSPEDPDVNLALARLARARHDTPAATRYYHHAIFAPGGEAPSIRDIRLELVRMLLDAGQAPRAVSELIAATIDLPEGAEARLPIAGLLLEAGDAPRALEQYRRVLSSDPAHHEALEGAVRAAFALGDYRQVTGYRLPDDAAPDARALVEVARAVRTRDPLASRLPAAERRRRLLRNVADVAARWQACAPDAPDDAPLAPLPPSLAELQKSARRTSIGRDAEQLEGAVGELDRLASGLEQRCGETTALERALHIIARSHGIGES